LIKAFLFVLFMFAANMVLAQPMLCSTDGKHWSRSGKLELLIGQDGFVSTSLPAETVRWYQLVPLALDYNNAEACRNQMAASCLQKIRYEREEIRAYRGKTTLPVGEIASLARAGTHWIQAGQADKQDEVETSSVPDAFQIVVRRGDAYHEIISELFGVPFVLYPYRLEDGRHQTDLRLASDCVAVVIYGRRRLGMQVPYMAPSALPRYMKEVGQKEDGRRKVRVGDVLYFGFQTAVLSKDVAPIGVLNDQDLVIHAYHGYVEEDAFGALPYRNSSFRVLRWPDQAGNDSGSTAYQNQLEGGS